MGIPELISWWRTEEKKVLIEVKGVTLKEGETARFPDAPSDRAVKHLEELIRAVEEGWEAYVFFVIQMKGVKKILPNVVLTRNLPKHCGKQRKRCPSVARDCIVTEDEIRIDREIPVCFPSEMEEGMAPEERVKCLPEAAHFLVQERKANLPWRKEATAYHVWVSEIMLQQTRVEAVKPFYARFLAAFRDEDLAGHRKRSY